MGIYQSAWIYDRFVCVKSRWVIKTPIRMYLRKTEILEIYKTSKPYWRFRAFEYKIMYEFVLDQFYHILKALATNLTQMDFQFRATSEILNCVERLLIIWRQRSNDALDIFAALLYWTSSIDHSRAPLELILKSGECFQYTIMISNLLANNIRRLIIGYI